MPTEFRQQSSTHIRGLNADQRTVDVIASDFSIDSYGTRIDPNGWDLEQFKRNPVICLQHDSYSDLPVANAIPESVRIENNQLLMTIQFPPEGTSEDSDTAFNLIKAGGVFGNLKHVWCGTEPGFRILIADQGVTDNASGADINLFDTAQVAIRVMEFFDWELSTPLRSDAMSLEESLATAERERPDLESLRWQITKTGADVTVAQRAGRPTIAPSLGWTYQYQGPIVQSDVNSWNASVTMSVPIFDRNQGNVFKAEAARRQTQWLYQARLLEVKAEVQQAVAELRVPNQFCR